MIPVRSNDRCGEAASRRGHGRLLRRVGLAAGAAGGAVVLALAVGFAWFVSILPSAEIKLDRDADGIVALTGGASRVTDALELLSGKRGQRLLISGANRMTDAKEMARLHPEFREVVRCCVDFDSSLNTLGNAVETRRWAKQRGIRSLIVVTSGYHMPRALAEIEHQLPDVVLIAYPVFSEQLKSEPWAAAVRRLALEYLKFVVAQLRMRVNPDAGRAD